MAYIHIMAISYIIKTYGKSKSINLKSHQINQMTESQSKLKNNG